MTKAEMEKKGLIAFEDWKSIPWTHNIGREKETFLNAFNQGWTACEAHTEKLERGEPPTERRASIPCNGDEPNQKTKTFRWGDENS